MSTPGRRWRSGVARLRRCRAAGVGAAADDERELPGEVLGVADPGVHALTAQRAVDVCGIACEQHAAASIRVGERRLDAERRCPLHGADRSRRPRRADAQRENRQSPLVVARRRIPLARAPLPATDRRQTGNAASSLVPRSHADAASRGRSRSACTSASRNRSTSGTPGNPTASALRTALWAPSAPITQPASTSLPSSRPTVTPSASGV